MTDPWVKTDSFPQEFLVDRLRTSIIEHYEVALRKQLVELLYIKNFRVNRKDNVSQFGIRTA